MHSHRFNPFLVGAVALLKTGSYLITTSHSQEDFVAPALKNDTVAAVSTTTMYTETIIMATVATVTLLPTAPASTPIVETITTTVTIASPRPTVLPVATILPTKQKPEEDYRNQSDVFAYLLILMESSSFFSKHAVESMQPIYEWYKAHEFLFQIFGTIVSCIPIWLWKRKHNSTIIRQQKTIGTLTNGLRTAHLDHAELEVVHQNIIAQHRELADLYTRQQSQIDRLKVEVLHGQEKALLFAQRHSQMSDVTEKAQSDLKDLQRRFNQVRESYKNLFTVLPEIAFREDLALDGEITDGDSALLAIANLQNGMQTIEMRE